MNELTEQMVATLSWMIEDQLRRRIIDEYQDGHEDVPSVLSPEMRLAAMLLEGLAGGLCRCR